MDIYIIGRQLYFGETRYMYYRETIVLWGDQTHIYNIGRSLQLMDTIFKAVLGMTKKQKISEE